MHPTGWRVKPVFQKHISKLRRKGRVRMNIRMKTQTVSCVVVLTLSFPAALGRSQRAHEPATVLVSVNTAGTAGGSYFDPVISANGRFVTFVSFASDLVTNDTNDTNGMLDVFVRDLKTGSTGLVSVNSAGTGSGNGSSGSAIARGGEIAAPPVISADGRFVAFVSFARDLVDNDTNGNQSDVFVRDLKTGTTTLVSVNSAGTRSGGGTSYAPVISADGRFVSFLSNATDLVAADDSNVTFDVFVRDLKTGTTTLASVNSAGTRSGGGTAPVISADGRFVAFLSDASNLVANDINGATDVFVRDLQTGTTTLVSVNSAGMGGDRASGLLPAGDAFLIAVPAISADRRFVAFVSLASDLVANDTNGATDVFVRRIGKQRGKKGWF